MFSSVQFSCSVVSDSLRPHESQHARPPCPSPTPRVHSDSRPSTQRCHPAISSSVVPFSSCLDNFLLFFFFFVMACIIWSCNVRYPESASLSFIFYYCVLFTVEKAMAPHSSTLAWKIPWMEEPGRLQSMGSLRVRHN